MTCTHYLSIEVVGLRMRSFGPKLHRPWVQQCAQGPWAGGPAMGDPIGPPRPKSGSGHGDHSNGGTWLDHRLALAWWPQWVNPRGPHIGQAALGLWINHWGIPGETQANTAVGHDRPQHVAFRYYPTAGAPQALATSMCQGPCSIAPLGNALQWSPM